MSTVLEDLRKMDSEPFRGKPHRYEMQYSQRKIRENLTGIEASEWSRRLKAKAVALAPNHVMVNTSVFVETEDDAVALRLAHDQFLTGILDWQTMTWLFNQQA
jgi:hypothetical protein